MKNELNTIAITGTTGGIGREVAFELAKMGKNLIFVDRNINKIEKLTAEIKKEYPNTNIKYVLNDLNNLNMVKNALKKLLSLDFDAIIFNAGIYNVKLKTLDSGYNNVFQTNFISQYYLAKKLLEHKHVKKIVATGSIAYKISKPNKDDIDYSKHKNQNKIYGNSKKYFMYSLNELTKNANVSFAVANPGITLTSLTAHFPKWINWFIKLVMKIIYPSTKKASKNVVYALLNDCPSYNWITPNIINVWGKPKIKPFKYSNTESKEIFDIANDIYNHIDKI